MTQSALPLPRHIAHLLILGLPLIGSHLAQFSIVMTDTVMLGWYDVEALAAAVLASSFFFTLFMIGSGFALAVMPMVAKAASQGDQIQCRRVTRMALWLSVLFAGLLMPLMWHAAAVLRAIGQEPLLAQLAQDYLRIAGWSMGPALLVMVLKSYLAAQDRTQIVLWVTVLGAASNGLTNWVLIFGNLGAPELGIKGAAVASLVNAILMLVGLGLYAVKALPEQQIFHRIWRPDWQAFGSVFRLGWPIGMTLLAESGLFAASSVMLGWLGVLPLAAHGIALQLTSGTFMVHIGLSQAATIRAGKAFGQKDAAGLMLGGAAALICSAVMVVLTIIWFLGAPEFLIGLFLSPNDPNRAAIITIGAGLLAVAALFQLADGAQVMALGLLRGVQDTRVPMILAVLSYWALGLPVAYWFGFTLDMGGIGVWLGLVVGLSFAAVTMLYRFWVLRHWQATINRPGR